MSDKMMRIAGRAPNGTAKPIKTDLSGNVGVYSMGSVSSTKRQFRIGKLNANTNEVLITVQKEATLQNLQIFFEGDKTGVHAKLELWTGQNLADGTHFVPYPLLASATSVTTNITPSSVVHDNLLMANENNVYLQTPLHVKGFQVRLINTTNEDVNLSCNVLWTEV